MSDFVVTRGGRNLHPCICGFTIANAWKLYNHQRKCSDWLSRANPVALQGHRAKLALSQPKTPKVKTCMYCQVTGGHDFKCPDNVVFGFEKYMEPVGFTQYAASLIFRAYAEWFEKNHKKRFDGQYKF
jgi:hypothetical protein